MVSCWDDGTNRDGCKGNSGYAGYLWARDNGIVTE